MDLKLCLRSFGSEKPKIRPVSKTFKQFPLASVKSSATDSFGGVDKKRDKVK